MLSMLQFESIYQSIILLLFDIQRQVKDIKLKNNFKSHRLTNQIISNQ